MFQPEFDRIGAGGGRQFVHEALDREHVVIGAERAHRRNPQRHRRDEVMHHPGVGEFVDRDRVAVAAAFRQWQRLRAPAPRTAAPCAAPPASNRRRPAASNGCCSRRRNSSRRSRRWRRAAPSTWSPSPGRKAPRHAPARASTARAPARRATRAQSARRRRRHRRRRYGRSSRSPRHGSAHGGRRHPQHFGDARRDRDRRPGCGSRPSWRRRPIAPRRRTARSSRAPDRAAYRLPRWSCAPAAAGLLCW